VALSVVLGAFFLVALALALWFFRSHSRHTRAIRDDLLCVLGPQSRLPARMDRVACRLTPPDVPAGPGTTPTTPTTPTTLSGPSGSGGAGGSSGGTGSMILIWIWILPAAATPTPWRRGMAA
jgi:hypothetical protein